MDFFRLRTLRGHGQAPETPGAAANLSRGRIDDTGI